MCLEFAAFVLSITALWVCILRNASFSFLALAMFFPGATALIWEAGNGELMSFMSKLSGANEKVKCIIFSALAVLLAVVMGWANQVEIRKQHNKSRFFGFLRAAGEEIGWRCFLLPCLLDRFSVLTAFTIRLKPSYPYLTVIVQSVSCLNSVCLLGWLAVKSGYSMWACSIMHWFWNIYKPAVSDTNTPEKNTGQQWLLDGDGLTDCIAMLPVAAVVVYDLNYKLF
ncbi:uncharacterized protein LOC132742797 isoform X2 [Ruditapes philippinarum]|uniref:uncharacterized protein LOC132742797 isoform X2 n=1 Tax=Ruditapes philippinarum TaxID=129788 RepID=UPI00295BEE67|nr:uncharacterized protein LOC132742797 isoform X2 [Ruditapes philippinarum]